MSAAFEALLASSRDEPVALLHGGGVGPSAIAMASLRKRPSSGLDAEKCSTGSIAKGSCTDWSTLRYSLMLEKSAGLGAV